MWPFRKKTPPEAVPAQASSMIRVLSVLTPQQQMEVGGLPDPSIAGTLDDMPTPGQPISAASFRVNPAFVEFMQHVIRTCGPDDAELQEAAREQGEGSVAVIDLRTPEGIDGNVPLVDIVGLFAVQSGELREYHANDKYRVFTEHGLVRLPPNLHALHIRELMRLKVEPSGESRQVQ
jgi:hypothetical protein